MVQCDSSFILFLLCIILVASHVFPLFNNCVEVSCPVEPFPSHQVPSRCCTSSLTSVSQLLSANHGDLIHFAPFSNMDLLLFISKASIFDDTLTLDGYIHYCSSCVFHISYSHPSFILSLQSDSSSFSSLSYRAESTSNPNPTEILVTEFESRSSSSSPFVSSNEQTSMISIHIYYSTQVSLLYTNINSLINEISTEVNTVFSNSNTNTQFIITSSLGFSESESLFNDFYNIIYSPWYNRNSLYNSSHDWFVNVHEERSLKGHDVVIALVSHDTSAGISIRNIGQENGFAVISVPFIQSSSYTFTRQVAYLFGAGNYRYQLVDPGPGLYSFSAGFRWYSEAEDLTYSTVMTTLPSRVVPFLSSPLLSFNGYVIGDANEADNARTIRQTRNLVSNFRYPLLSFIITNFVPIVPSQISFEDSSPWFVFIDPSEALEQGRVLRSGYALNQSYSTFLLSIERPVWLEFKVKVVSTFLDDLLHVSVGSYELFFNNTVNEWFDVVLEVSEPCILNLTFFSHDLMHSYALLSRFRIFLLNTEYSVRFSSAVCAECQYVSNTVQWVPRWGSITVDFYMQDDWVLKSFLVNGAVVTLDPSDPVFYNIVRDSVIVAVWEYKYCSLNITHTNGGSLSPALLMYQEVVCGDPIEPVNVVIDVGYLFHEWQGLTEFSDNSTLYIGSLTTNLTINAVFIIDRVILEATTDKGGEIIGPMNDVIKRYSIVAVYAQPSRGYSFLKWSNDSTANPLGFLMAEDMSIKAVFGRKPFSLRDSDFTWIFATVVLFVICLLQCVRICRSGPPTIPVPAPCFMKEMKSNDDKDSIISFSKSELSSFTVSPNAAPKGRNMKYPGLVHS
ncbi:hypothetical protein RCL1_000057 [Eukaryota sp. TZLM3-RCL]